MIELHKRVVGGFVKLNADEAFRVRKFYKMKLEAHREVAREVGLKIRDTGGKIVIAGGCGPNPEWERAFCEAADQALKGIRANGRTKCRFRVVGLTSDVDVATTVTHSIATTMQFNALVKRIVIASNNITAAISPTETLAQIGVRALSATNQGPWAVCGTLTELPGQLFRYDAPGIPLDVDVIESQQQLTGTLVNNSALSVSLLASAEVLQV